MSFDKLASKDTLASVTTALKEHGIDAAVVDNEIEALEMIKTVIPAGASVMNGASRTLEQIGFIDYLKSSTHGWNNLHEAIVKETDQAKQGQLRKQALLADYYLGSVHALAETGEFIIASNTGSQLPHVVYSSPNLIFVVGAQKIVPTLSDAMTRLEEYVVPLEDERMKQAYGMGTMLSKIVIFRRENAMMGRKVRMILVKKQLGF